MFTISIRYENIGIPDFTEYLTFLGQMAKVVKLNPLVMVS